MRDLNRVMLIGNLGKDPETRYTSSGMAITTFPIATNRTYLSSDGSTQKRETEWFNIVTWNKLAEKCSQYLAKGRRVYVEGRFQTRSWEGQDKETHYRTEVVANDVFFLDRAPSIPSDPETEDENGESDSSNELPF